MRGRARTVRRLAAAALVALAGLLAPQAALAFDIWHDCPGTITEGNAGDMVMYSDFDGISAYHVSFYTDAGTAGASDYTVHDNNRVTFTESPSTFSMQTTEDDLVEGDETFTLRYRKENVRRCTITIRDDDPRVTRVDMVSTPAFGDTYSEGETVEFALTFSHAVDAQGAGVGMTIGGEYQSAGYRRGTGTDTIVFGYTVRSGDRDDNGVSVRDGYYDGDGNPRGIWNVTAAGTDIAVYASFSGLSSQSGHKVNGKREGRPEVTDVAMVSTPSNGHTYAGGKSIEFALTFSEAVDAEGGGTGITVGDTYQSAGYRRGTGTDTIVFGYTVASGDRDDDGVSVRDGYYDSDGDPRGIWNVTARGTDVLVDAEFTGLANQSGHKVDGRLGPRVASVAVSSTAGPGDIYRIGERVEATVAFGLAVRVEAGAGTPYLELDVGAAARRAAYARAGAGPAELVFAYTVAEGDLAAGGIGWGEDALRLNGGFILIEAAALAPDDLRHAAREADGTHLVDGVRPSLVEASAWTTPDAALVLVFSEPLDTGSTPAPGAFTVLVDGAGRTVTAVEVGETRGEDGPEPLPAVRLTLAAPVAAGETVTLTYDEPATHPIRDAVGNAADAAELAGVEVAVRSASVVSVAADADEIEEGEPAWFTLARTGPAGAALTVGVYVTQQGAFTTETGAATVTFAAGASTAAFSVGTTNDALGEDDGAVTVLILDPGNGNATSATAGSATVTVKDGRGDFKATVSLAAEAYTVSETAGVLAFGYIVRMEPGVSPFAIHIAISTRAQGTAVGGQDFETQTKQVAILPGDFALEGGLWVARKTLPIPIHHNERGTFEGDEQFGVIIERTPLLPGSVLGVDPATGMLVSLDLRSTVTITDDLSDHVPPAPSQAWLAGTALSLVFDEPLDEGSVPSPGAFVVEVEGAARAVSAVAVDGATVALTLASAPAAATVSYLAPAHGAAILDLAGNAAAGFVRHPVRDVGARAWVSAVTFVSAPAADGIYGEDEVVEVRVAFTEAVEVSGAPELVLEVGTAERRAAFVRDDGAAGLVFAYEVSDSDYDGDGVEALRVQGGEIEAERAFSPVRGGFGQRVNGGGTPFIRGIALTSTPREGGVYGADERVEVTLTFNEPVVTVQNDGFYRPEHHPYVSLEVGAKERSARYRRGSGSARLVFDYLLESDDFDADGVSVAADGQGSLEKSQATVKDLDGNDVETGFDGFGNQAGHRVDGGPRIVGLALSPPANGHTYGLGETIEATLRYSRAVSAPVGTKLKLRIGDGDAVLADRTGGGAREETYAYVVGDDDVDRDGVSIPADPFTPYHVTASDGTRVDANFDGAGPFADRKVDGAGPRVEAVSVVSSPASGDTYRRGETNPRGGRVRRAGVPSSARPPSTSSSAARTTAARPPTSRARAPRRCTSPTRWRPATPTPTGCRSSTGWLRPTCRGCATRPATTRCSTPIRTARAQPATRSTARSRRAARSRRSPTPMRSRSGGPR